MKYSEFREYLRLSKIHLESKIIYVCKTEEEVKELCSVFNYPTNVHLDSTEPIGLRVEYGEAKGHNVLSCYKWGDRYKDYKFIECFEDAIDDVKSPKRYKLEGLELESKDIIRSVLGKEGYKSWCRGTALMYLFRAGKKEDELKDLKKAKEYISWIIKEMED